MMADSLEKERDSLARLAEEQAALRRVATLVASGTPPAELFAAVTDEVGRLLPVEYALLGSYEPDGALAIVSAWGNAGVHAPIGSRRSLGGKNLATIVFDTARSARIDNFGEASGPLGIATRESGVRSAVGTPILVEGHLWGAVIAGSRLVQPLPGDIETRLANFTELVATAIANAENRAALAASRARIVAAADESRRRIERDLHDGAQQRLVALSLSLRLVRSRMEASPDDAAELLDECVAELLGATSELRELARGIHPAILTDRGLDAALRAVAARAPVPVEVASSVTERLPAQVEAAAYFVVAEALTNVARYAGASRAEVRVERGESAVTVEVSDDGTGGADPAAGSGLRGLADRLATLDGTLAVVSPSGEGTIVRAVIPCV
jgi:signal transduction histidine kinase